MLSFASLLLTFSALVNAETDISYAPVSDVCPALNSSAIYNDTTHEGFVRSNYLISQDEYSYVSARQIRTTENLINFLDNLNIPDYNETSFSNYFEILNQSTINVGLSFSGGGFRALFTGAGEIMALDSRTTYNSSLKGLLDSSTYIAGLSGGSILLSTLAFNNWTSVENLIDDNSTSIWNTTHSPISKDLSYWKELLAEVEPKKEAGYEITLLDIYGRILSRYMFEQDDDSYGLNTLWSDLKYSAPFQDYEIPFPIISATGGVDNNISDYSLNVFEITPFEFGSFSPLVGGFIPIEILGTSLEAGLPSNFSSCTYDFDNVGFLTAASSNILADFQDILTGFLAGNETDIELVSTILGQNITVQYAELILNLVNSNYNHTLFGIVNNPFYETSLSSNNSDIEEFNELKLVDGGFFSESIPLDSYLAPVRSIDVVFAFDNSASSTDNWPDGDSLFATEERWFESYPNDNFYELPSSIEDFVELGLNKKPSFFGCNGSSLITDLNNPNATVEFNIMKPLIVYIPNNNITYMSNITNYQFSLEERDALVENGFELAQNDDEDDFAQCIGCAIIRRSEERADIELSPFCQSCFEKYCYTDSYTPDYTNISESAPYSVYASSAVPSQLSSIVTKSKSTASIAFPTSFSA
ncbi:Lysophospholipase 1 [Pichia californica]|uniref:Lysophospholipase n=1 Tax=Pichia californica TaxID=460514 RepID=A0A9P6WHF6_9ASCO|nr:Lysophospholipase 1 [[Candida] californica]KAG0686936.1 Lysophospholipase 1 [[Candida] californica]